MFLESFRCEATTLVTSGLHTQLYLCRPPNSSIALLLTVLKISAALLHFPACNQRPRLLRASLQVHWHPESKLLSHERPMLSWSAKGREIRGERKKKCIFLKEKVGARCPHIIVISRELLHPRLARTAEGYLSDPVTMVKLVSQENPTRSHLP